MSAKDTAQWTDKGHTIFIGPVEPGEIDRHGKRRWHRPILIDGKLVATSQGRNLMTAKWRAMSELKAL